MWSFPLALLGLCVLAYGLLIPRLGFYQDDWVAVWFAHAFGPGVFVDFFAQERPFYAGVYMLTHTLVGDSALAWQVFGLLSRWLLALAAWWTLHAVWPRHPRQTALVAVLFAVYPSFREQSASVAFSQNFLVMGALIASIGVMAWTVRLPSRRVPLTLLGMALAAFGLFSAEYFMGIGLLRPVFLWFVLSEEPVGWRTKLRRLAATWAPYLAVLAASLFWRIFIFQFPTYDPKLLSSLLTQPRQAALVLLQTIVQDAVDVSVFAWVQTLDVFRTLWPGWGQWLAQWGLVGLAAAAAALYLARLGKSQPAGQNQPGAWSRQALLAGGLSFVTVGWPYWLTNLPVELDISNDRFTLAFLFGASLLLVGLIELLVENITYKALVVGALAGLAVGLHFRTAQVFAQVHHDQEKFFRQLAWRAPGLEPGTLLLTNVLPIEYSGANSLASAVNWVYTTRYSYPDMDYQYYFISEKASSDLFNLEPGHPIHKDYRSLVFSGSTSQAVVAYFHPARCLQVVDPAVHSSLSVLPEDVTAAMHLSDLGRILPDETGALARVDEIFGPAPEKDWCEYFEKADLARQMGDWQQIARLGDKGLRATGGPGEKNAEEYLPFIEGYARSGDWQQAVRLSERALSSAPRVRAALCSAWERIRQETSTAPAREQALSQVAGILQCQAP